MIRSVDAGCGIGVKVGVRVGVRVGVVMMAGGIVLFIFMLSVVLLLLVLRLDSDTSGCASTSSMTIFEAMHIQVVILRLVLYVMSCVVELLRT